jgi:small-conductance mechanosensitive channel
MDILALVLFFGLVAMFVIRAWKAHGRLSGGDRWALITSFAVAITTFVVAPLLINWVIVPTAIWLIAVALLTGGVVGAVLRWSELAWFTGTHPIRRAVGVGITLVTCTLIIVVAVT